MRQSSTSYLTDYMEPGKLVLVVEAAYAMLQREADAFDYIAFRGVSGSLIAPLLALRMGKGLIAVRKAGHGSHSQNDVELPYDALSYRNMEKPLRYIIVDDLVSTGDTLMCIKTAIAEAMPEKTCIPYGVYLYHDDNYTSRHYIEGLGCGVLLSEDKSY